MTRSHLVSSRYTLTPQSTVECDRHCVDGAVKDETPGFRLDLEEVPKSRD